jgi:methyltransferase (TIGR00027 family)
MRLTGVPATALAIATQRMLESRRPDRLFDDALAERFVQAGGALDTSGFPRRDTTKNWEVHRGFFALRTRFFDDYLLEAGCGQVVLLAAGLDTRAYRLPWPDGVRLFEIDLPEVMDFKAEVLGSEPPRCARVALAADLTGDWVSPLVDAGFRPDEPTAWLIEGLLMYLSREDCEELIGTVSGVSAPGSAVAVENRGSALIRDADTGALLAPGVRSPTCDWLEARGWLVTAHAVAEIGERYGRPVPPEFDPPGPRPEGLLCAVRP